MSINSKNKVSAAWLTALLCLLSVIFLAPVFIILINSFKSKLYIMGTPFTLPNPDTFVGFQNYVNGVKSSDLILSFGRSVFITVFSVFAIIFLTSMTAWFIVRVNNAFTKIIYYAFVFSMIVPFQMVMFTMTYTVNVLRFNNPVGIIPVYLGFGSGLSVFMMTGFLRSVPMDLEEAAMIDGCTGPQIFFRIVFPIMKPTLITVAILNAMWIWNDYLLPYLILGSTNKTMPVAIQLAMQGAYGSVDWGGFMAMLVLAIIPIVIFYLFGQKYIIKGVMAGAVKG
ncbi:MAG: carbohydrate ABC transporter permease [Oscillospiraceae bacterium]|nr:carbohydrate ABC transporter permease [Oscillospiraceae bacterium]